MLKKILVPLDGSALGAKVLPVVENLAMALQATVYLLRVEALPRGASGGAFRAAAAYLSDVQLPRSESDLDMARHPVYKGSEMASQEAEAKSTLLPVAQQLKDKGIQVEVAVVFGRPAGSILKYADSEKMDLIIMSTHGEGGLDAYAFGPTADRVARRAIVPILLIRPEEVSRMLPFPKIEDLHL